MPGDEGYEKRQEWFNCSENVYWKIYNKVNAKNIREEIIKDDECVNSVLWI